MTRSELVAQISSRFPQLVQRDAELAVAEILGAVGSALSSGGRVEIRGFGSFSLNYRPPRIARNPKTGEKVSVPGKWIPHFKAGKELRELVDQQINLPDYEPDFGRITSTYGPEIVERIAR